MFGEYTELKTYRFERKFVASHMSRLATEIIIKQNQAFFTPVFIPRCVNNIYFDTQRLDCYFDNLFGNGNRWKCRIRWYGNLFGKIESAVLEFKIKRGAVGTKHSYKIPGFTFDKYNFGSREIENIFANAELPDSVKEKLARFQPVLLNSYDRSYFISKNEKYRVTVDDNLKYYNLRTGWNLFTKPYTEDLKTVVELKYDEEWNRDADMITTQFPFRLDKNSKFVAGMSHFRNEIAI